MLEAVGTELWSYEATYRLGALAIPHRVTIWRAPSGGLVVHAPCKPDEPARTLLADLGVVDSVVWPSWWHDLYLRAWAAAYPSAKLYVSPRLRRAAIPAAILDEARPPWPDVDLLYVDKLPALLDEFVFLHRPSRTLVVADLVVNVRADLPRLTRAFFGLMGAYPGPRIPWFYATLTADKQHLRKTFQRMLAWDFDRLVVGHGDVVRTGAKSALERAVRERLPL